MSFFPCWALAPILAPLARTEKGAARRGGAKVKKNVAVAVARKINGANSRHFRAIFERNFA